ncbi:alpha/beta hydrolase fold domain-containing protein [Hirsutella rhossiliensis]|uniref:Alpha/beta hydrolase fold domain-containing protein n=1 Tax=Hirsutella rhossiliensis TaxID=111463 RepID=A0A9P8MW16_9HYPO|nr:alpha/beta hydrolase fold domain-containing protein [Hirsutella rhossiliensis]KAH0960207.1 alpha/beta hydrolase fold domain-containing protein [Hirsutella rhossiliensis]
MSSQVEPFRIEVPDSAIQRLKEKLAASTFADEVDFSDDWNYGAPLADVKRLAAYWRQGFDWRAHEAKLNELPQFQTRVAVEGFGELNIYLVHKRSSQPGSIPLLFCHGWPGSFVEVNKILPLLTEADQGPSFHVVAPSLPNFGFSDGVIKRGFGIPQYAETLHKVMLKLGYDKYVTQGGDWGFIVTRLMAVQYPEHCLATHVNFHAIEPYSELEKKGLERSAWFRKEGYGYNVEQSTKPSTLGFGMADSPVALLAWIYEKLHDWTDDYPWTDDEVLAWISIYQFSTAGPAASLRIYYESRHAEMDRVARGVEYVPRVLLGYSVFPRDVVVVPKTWARTLGPVVFERFHKEGGHFASHERPDQLVADLRDMFGARGGAGEVARVFSAKDSRL